MSTAWVVAYVALAVTVVCEGGLFVGLLRRVGPALERLESDLAGRQFSPLDSGLRVGEIVPQFTLWDQQGRSVPSRELWSADGAVVLLTDEHCVACQQLLSALSRESWHNAVHQLLVIRDQIGDEPIAGPVAWLQQHDGSATRAFHSFVSPQAFLVSATGRVVARSVPQSVDDLRSLDRLDTEARTDFTKLPPEVQIHGHHPVE